jgi:hypothetical protein
MMQTANEAMDLTPFHELPAGLTLDRFYAVCYLHAHRLGIAGNATNFNALPVEIQNDYLNRKYIDIIRGFVCDDKANEKTLQQIANKWGIIVPTVQRILQDCKRTAGCCL